MRIVERVWENPHAHFEDHAAVTELYLCSTENSSSGGRRLTEDSPCADEYLAEVIDQVRPAVIVAAGQPPRDYLLCTSRANDDTNPFKVSMWCPTERSMNRGCS